MSVLKKRAAWLGVAVLMGSLAAAPRLAGAHGAPIALESWGNWGQAASCQRILGRATRLCFEVAARDVLSCADARLAGEDCTPDTSGVQQRTTALIAANCSNNQLHVLGFNAEDAVTEAQLDLTNACTQQVEALKSLIYGPAMFDGDVAAGPVSRDRCLRTASRYSFRVARTALRERTRALDQIGSSEMSTDAKHAVLAAAEAKIDGVRQKAMDRISAKCGAEFTGSYTMSADTYANLLTARADSIVAASQVIDAVSCPAPQCGNGVIEPACRNTVDQTTEECDDGNTDNTDACDTNCKRTSCTAVANTYDLIQTAIFENHGCTASVCHGDARQGNLDLRAPGSYDNLVDAPSTISSQFRVEKLSWETSFLYRKLAAATLGTTVEGTPMPNGMTPLSTTELAVIKSWIYHGAPRTGVVPDTPSLNACLPPADPIQADPPAPPAADEGVQLHMPKLDLPPHSENEVCFASYYDFSAQVPPGVEKIYANQTTFRFKKKTETQDPLSHHLIIHAYLGQYGTEHPGWGAWTCKGGVKNGEACDPKDPNSCDSDGACGSEPKRSVACIGFGPPDYTEVNAPAFGGTQQPLSVSKWSPGVYSEIPVKGIIVWNAHAFNTTARPAKVEAWVNFDFAQAPEQISPVQGGLEETQQIFIMNNTGGVTPFTRKRYCWDHTFAQGSRLFELGSHMHKRGKLFEIFNPAGEKIYTSTQYNDPVQLTYDPPLHYDDPDPATRTYHYCAEYDNGFTHPDEVAKRSTFVPPPPPFPSSPCSPTYCTEGKAQEKCTGSSLAAKNASCDSTPGAGDGLCDACPLMGGVTTENEMFLLISYYYCDPGFPDTCKNDYGFLSGGNNGSASIE